MFCFDWEREIYSPCVLIGAIFGAKSFPTSSNVPSIQCCRFAENLHLLSIKIWTEHQCAMEQWSINHCRKIREEPFHQCSTMLIILSNAKFHLEINLRIGTENNLLLWLSFLFRPNWMRISFCRYEFVWFEKEKRKTKNGNSSAEQQPTVKQLWVVS